MAKMRKEYDPNKAARRKRRPIICIICEGKETETLYFKHFRSRNLKDCDAVISILKSRGYLENYEKSVDVFDELFPKQEEAIERAKERVERLSADQTNVISRDSNPVTTVWKI